MSFWNKLGKIALQAAPYVAAPFTGGASLYAVPATQKLGAKWAESDAQKNAAKGLGPSSFDRALGGVSNVVGMVGGSGALNKGTGGVFGGGKFAPPSALGGNNPWQAKLANVLGGDGGYGGGGLQGIMNGNNPYQIGSDMSSQGGITGNMPYPGGQQSPGLSRFHRQMRRQLGPVMGQEDQNNPNLADSIGAGRMEAIKNQPFRGGYDVKTLGDDEETTYTSRMPPIYPTGRRRKQAVQ